jgi:hypothetical protein
MQDPIFLMSWVAGVCALWFIWNLGIRNLFLASLRERLFELRFDLFRLGMDGDLPFNSDTYRAIETLLCGVLRFAHRITVLTYFSSRIEQERAKSDKDYVDVSAQIALKISRLDPATQEKLTTLLTNARSAIVLYMAVNSLLFMAVIACFLVAKWLGLWSPDGARKELSAPIEREAYRMECNSPLRPAHA